MRTLAQLLLAASEREVSFEVGTLIDEPEKLGFADAPSDLASEYPKDRRFDVRLHGNGNGGHEFGTGLTVEQKKALLEFMKVLSDDDTFP